MDSYDVTKKGAQWACRKEGSREPIVAADTKDHLLPKVSNYMRMFKLTGSVKIHSENGDVQEERTFPGDKT
jgi:hypothetical protein